MLNMLGTGHQGLFLCQLLLLSGDVLGLSRQTQQDCACLTSVGISPLPEDKLMSTAETTDRQNSESVQASSSGPRIVFVSHDVVKSADEGYHQVAARELPKFRS